MDDTNEVEEATPPEIPADEPMPSDEESEGVAAEDDEVEQDGVEDATVESPDSGAAAAAAASPDTSNESEVERSFSQKAKGALSTAGAATLKAGQKLGVNTLLLMMIMHCCCYCYCHLGY